MKEKLLDLIKNSYAPYSGVHFASIVETENGNLYEGVNIENASFGGTICAERNAINNAVSHGERSFKALFLMTDKKDLCMPCHICKQSMLEFFSDKTVFYIMNTSGEEKVMSMKELMETTFSKEDLK